MRGSAGSKLDVGRAGVPRDRSSPIVPIDRENLLLGQRHPLGFGLRERPESCAPHTKVSGPGGGPVGIWRSTATDTSGYRLQHNASIT
jgi:hypothetical protein